MLCQVIANENLLLLFADVKAAFAQSDKLVRPNGDCSSSHAMGFR